MTEASKLNPAIVIGASGGIGKALADMIDEEAGDGACLRLARSFDGDRHIDITDESSIAAAAARSVESHPDARLIVVATGLLHEGAHGPEKALDKIEPEWLDRVLRVNAVGPLLVAKHFLPVMAREGEIRFAALSARVGSIADNRSGGWYGYRMGKAALNMALRNVAIEWRRKNDRSIIVGLHPGTVDTGLSEPFQANVPAGKLFDRERAALQLLDVLEELKPPQSGRIFAWDGSEIAP